MIVTYFLVLNVLCCFTYLFF